MKTCLNCQKLITGQQVKFCSRSCANKYRSIGENRICLTCGGVFHVSPSQEQRYGRYCSRACSAVHPSLVQKTKKCEQCRQDYPVKSRRDLEQRRFCSNKCYQAYRLAAMSTITCLYCGKNLSRTATKVERTQQNFCSGECFYAWHRGENNHRWLGGHDSYRGPNWQAQRTLARERDNYTCQQCSITESELGKELDVHHIKPYRLFPDDITANVLDNLQALCHDCHLEVERPLLRL